MKRFNYYLSLMLLLVFTAACSDEFDQPPMVIPTADHTANMTIAEFKAKHWQDDRNYIDTVKEDEIIHGWVTSSDESGNVYKSLYIMDESGYGLSISINQNSLYNNYRIGQEIVLPLKGYFVGKYNGQQQLGYPAWYAAGNAWEATFLPQAMWESLVELNGLPDLSKIDTLEVNISDFQGKNDPETLMKYQGRLVRFRGVTFQEADGVTPFSEANASTNRTLADADGNTLTVRNSNYADFRADILPEGELDVVGLLGSYGTTWQLVLRSAEDVIGGGSAGTKSQPYTVAEALSLQENGKNYWFGGYVVGAVAPEVTSVSSNNDIEWKAPTTLENTLVIADDAECKDYTKCIIVPLPQGSTFREEANLRQNTNVYKTYLKVKGRIEPYMSLKGIDNSGAKSDYVLDVAYTKLNETFDNGIPDGWTNLNVSGTNKWDKGTYNDTEVYAKVTGYKGSNPPFDIWLITPKLDIKNAKNKVFTFDSQVNNYGTNNLEVYLMDTNDPRTATVKVKLNAMFAPRPTSSAYSGWYPSGDIDLSQWDDGSYYVGFNYYAPNDPDNNYTTWCIDNVTFGMGMAGGKSDFETMRAEGTTTLGTYTSNAGWVATNCYLLDGKDGSNPHFPFIGYALNSTSQYAIAPTMSGGTNTVGTIVSPTLKNGMSKLQFNYGCAYSGSQLAFRVDVKQGGNVVKTWTITNDNVAQKTVYTFAEDCVVNGNFTIEFTNLCPSNSTTSTKDRLSVWNVHWEPVD